MKYIKKYYDNIFLQSFMATFAITINCKLTTSNIATVVVAILYYLAAKKCLYKHVKTITIIAIVFSVFTVMGSLNSFTLFFENKVLKIAGTCISLLGWFYLYRLIINNILEILTVHNFYSEKQNNSNGKKVFIGCLLICLISWVPYFYAYYPGVLTYDSIYQMKQIFGIIEYTNHHPWLHTLIIKFFYNIGYYLFRNINAGVAAYSLFQMLLMAITFSYTIYVFYTYKINKKYLIICLLFYSIMPFNARYVITMWKDILFAATVLLFSVILWECCNKRQLNKFKWCGLFVLGIFMCLLRSNGFFAYLMTAPFIIFFLKEKRKIIFGISITTIIIVSIFKGPVMNAYGVQQPDAIEALSIPVQHIARVIKDGKELSKEQYELLNKVVDVQAIPGTYNNHISDSMKELVRAKNNQEYIKEHKLEFFKLWIQLGIEYPQEYIKAQIDQTAGYWYPDIQFWVSDNGVLDNDLGITRETNMPASVLDFLSKFYDCYKIVPVYGILWSIGIATWLVIILFSVTIIKKKCILPFIPILSVLVSLMIATPVYAEFRYIYSLFITMPLFIVIACSDYNKKTLELVNNEEIGEKQNE